MEKQALELFEKYGDKADQVERSLKVLSYLDEKVAAQILERPDYLEKVIPTLSKIVQVLESKFAQKALALMPKVAHALTKAVPVLGAYQAGKDAYRLMQLAQTGKSAELNYSKDARALALTGSGMNQVDTLLGLLEITGVGNLDFLPQVLLAGGELGIEILIELYKDEPMPPELARVCKLLNLSQALVSPPAAQAVKEIYGLEGQLELTIELGKTLQEMGLKDHHLSNTLEMLVLKHQHPEGLTKTLFNFLKTKGGDIRDFLWEQIKSKSISLKDAVSAYAGDKWQDIQAFLGKGLSKGAEQLDEILQYLIESPPGRAAEFLLNQIERGALQLKDVALRLAEKSQAQLKALLEAAAGKGGKLLAETVDYLESSKAGQAAEFLLDLSRRGLISAQDALKALKDKGLSLSSNAAASLQDLASKTASQTGKALKTVAAKTKKTAAASIAKTQAVKQVIDQAFAKVISKELTIQQALTEAAEKLKKFGFTEASTLDELMKLCFSQPTHSDAFKAALEFIVDDVRLGGAKKLAKYIAIGVLSPVAIPVVLAYIAGKGAIWAAEKTAAFTKEVTLAALNKGGKYAEVMLEVLKDKGENLVEYLAEAVKKGELKYEKAVEALQSLGSQSAEAIKSLTARLQDSGKAVSKKVGQSLQTLVSDLREKQQKLLNELDDLLKANVPNAYAKMQALTRRMSEYVDEMKALIEGTGIPENAKLFANKLVEFYGKIEDAAARSTGEMQKLLRALADQTRGVIEGVINSGSKVGSAIAKTFNAIKDKFILKPIQNLDRIEALARRLNLDEAGSKVLQKMLGYLEGANLERGLKLLEELGPHAKQILQVLDYVPDFVLRKAMESETAAKLLLTGVREAVSLVTKYGGKLVGNADAVAKLMVKIAPKIATGICKAIPAIGAFFSAYDTVRTGKIFYTGEWYDPISGSTSKYNPETRMMAYMAAGINLVDTALGIAEYFPPANAVTGAPQIATAVASLALDILIDVYNDGGLSQMTDGAKDKLEMASYGIAMATMDPFALQLIQSFSSNRFKQSGKIMADMVQSYVRNKTDKAKGDKQLLPGQQNEGGQQINTPEEIAAFVRNLSWSTADDSIRVFFESLEQNGTSLTQLMKSTTPPPLNDEAIRLLFNNLRTVFVKGSDKDTQYLRELLQVSNIGPKAEMINSLMNTSFWSADFWTNDEEEGLIYDGIMSVSGAKNLNALFAKVSPESLTDELWDDNGPDDYGRFIGVLSKTAIELDDTNAPFSRMLSGVAASNTRKVWIGLNKELVSKGKNLGDWERLAMFDKFLQAADFQGLATMFEGECGTCCPGMVKNKKVLDKMLSKMVSQAGNFLGFFSSNKAAAAELTMWVLQYGSQEQFTQILKTLQNSAWFRDKGGVLREIIQLAQSRGISLKDKLNSEAVRIFTDGLNNGWSKISNFFSNDYQSNMQYLTTLFTMVSNNDDKTNIIRSLMDGWTPGPAESAIFQMMKYAGDTDVSAFTYILDKIGMQRFANELENHDEASWLMAEVLMKYGANYAKGTYERDPSLAFSQMLNAWNTLASGVYVDNMIGKVHKYLSKQGQLGQVHRLSSASRQNAMGYLSQYRAPKAVFWNNLSYLYNGEWDKVGTNPYQPIIDWLQAPGN